MTSFSSTCLTKVKETGSLGGSPWELPTCYLFLQLWDCGISPSIFEIIQVPTWIEIKDLPLEFFPFQHLSRVLKPLGTLVCVEQETLYYSDLRWIRAMLMVDLTKPRYSQIHVNCGGKISTIYISYFGNNRVCIRCGGFGHPHGGCGGPPGSGKDWSRNFLMNNSNQNHSDENLVNEDDNNNETQETANNTNPNEAHEHHPAQEVEGDDGGQEQEGQVVTYDSATDTTIQ